ncbi:hypothetical protein [Gemella sanguinis]|uniref:hypothetical protein n=1 Tax=Gemella sanguinis TaxID=84135 RepID=UPI0015E151AD|nr:hypothetical protein [Gemella sanguinis]
MEKIIKLSIENTTKIRQVEDSFCELYSHDKNNGAFEFEISKGTLTNENVVALFKFLRSGSYWKTNGIVEDNKIKFNFDTSLITQNEEVVCYIYLDKEERNSDIFRFRFKVNLSEIDKASQLPVKERFFANSMIVDRVDVLTKEDFDNAIAEISKGSKFLTEDKANERYALKGDIPNVSDFVSSTQLSDYALRTDIPDSETIVNKAVEKVEKKGYLTEHQSLANYVTETQLNDKGYLTQHQDISKLATKKAVDDVAAKVTQLEARPVTSSYDDSEIKRKLKELEDRPTTANIDTSNFVTTTQLEDKHYLTEHQSLAGYVTETQLEGKNYLTEHQDISKLATKEQLDELRNSRPTVDTSDLVTKEQLRKAFLDEEEHEKYAKKSELPQPYNDTDIKSRLTTLENRPAGNVDTSNLVSRGDLTTLELTINRKLNGEGGIFTNTGYKEPFQYFQDTRVGNPQNYYGRIYSNNTERIIISNASNYTNLDTALYTLASSIPDGYTPDFEFSESDNLKFITTQNIHNYIPANTGNTTELDKRLKVLEANTGNTTELDKRLKAIESNPANTTVLDNRLKVLEAKQWEIHGRGMPNGVVTAPVGTTYVDEAVTNGALKWIKKSGTGNTGWEVLIGDTGWKILPSVSKLGNSFVKIRRVNNVVSYQFGGLSWGWFGIVRRGGAGYVLQGSDRERNCYIIQNGGIPIGYRAEASLIGNIYNDKGVSYGTWYLGGNGDYNQLRFQFTDPVPTDRDIGDIRISSISYLTNEAWPQN